MSRRRNDRTLGPDRERDRGLSIAVTHVMTIGITTILIAMLLMSGSTMLESETERSAQTSLETVGERLAGEIENVDRIAGDENDSVTVTADHPRTVANTRYLVDIRDDCDDAPLIEDDVCLQLTATEHDIVVHVPLHVSEDRLDADSEATGGSVTISYGADGDEEIKIEDGN